MKKKKRILYKEQGNRGVVILKNSKKWGSRKKSRLEVEETEGQTKVIASSCLFPITTHRPLSLLRWPWPAVTDQQDSQTSPAPLISYVNWYKLLILSKSQFPHLWNGDNYINLHHRVKYINLHHRVVMKTKSGNAYDASVVYIINTWQILAENAFLANVEE